MKKNDYIRLSEKYIRDEATEEERERLFDWIRHNEKINWLMLKRLEQAACDVDHDTEMRMYEHIRTSILPKNKQVCLNRSWRKTIRQAAVWLLPILSAWSVYLFTSRPSSENDLLTIIAPPGERAEVVLTDGSRVWINSGSTLTCDGTFNHKERRVFLKGEAYFEVQKDARCPFIVHAGEMEIEALGTSFNVNAYPDINHVSSVLLEGSIRVNAEGEEHILSENEQIIFDRSSHTLSTGKVYAADFIQWKEGNLYFENRSFDEIALTLSRVFNVEIRFASEELRAVRFSGTLGGGSIRNALDILSLTSSMCYEMNGTTVVLYCK